jgi:hypothetical protein
MSDLWTLIIILVLSKGAPFYPTLFGIYIDKIAKCLKEEGCIDINIVGIIVIILLCVDDINFIAKSIEYLRKQLKLLNNIYAKITSLPSTLIKPISG